MTKRHDSEALETTGGITPDQTAIDSTAAEVRSSLEEQLLQIGEEIQRRVATLGMIGLMMKHPSAPPLTVEGRRQCYAIGHALRSAVEIVESAGDHATASAIQRTEQNGEADR